MKRDLAFSKLDLIYKVNSTVDLLNAFDAFASDFGVHGFVLITGDAGVEIAAKTATAENERLHFGGCQVLASCPRDYRLALNAGVPVWVPQPEGVAAGDTTLFQPSEDHAEFEVGLQVPTRTPEGKSGLVSFLPRASDPDGEGILWRLMLALALHSRLEWIEAHAEDGMRHFSRRALSPREHQVLEWMARGKSADDVASILEISAATVMFHYRNVAERYGTLNRTHTVVEAMRRGELALAALAPVALAPVVEIARALVDSYTI